jgi:hypothetical protein
VLKGACLTLLLAVAHRPGTDRHARPHGQCKVPGLSQLALYVSCMAHRLLVQLFQVCLGLPRQVQFDPITAVLWGSASPAAPTCPETIRQVRSTASSTQPVNAALQPGSGAAQTLRWRDRSTFSCAWLPSPSNSPISSSRTPRWSARIAGRASCFTKEVSRSHHLPAVSAFIRQAVLTGP